MEYANIYRGDVNSAAMSTSTRYLNGTRWIGFAGVLLYLIHIITHIVMHSQKTRTKEFIDIERKVFIPLLALGSLYLVHFFHWWPIAHLWVLIVFWVASCIACMITSCRQGCWFKLIFSITLGLGILWWFIYWIMLVYNT
jgi:hypothetical protein